MDPILSWMCSKQNELIAFLRELVECESPSDDASAVDRFGELFADRLSAAAKVKRVPAKGSPLTGMSLFSPVIGTAASAQGGKGSRGCYGKHLVCEFTLPGRKKSGQLLALGHMDTVWPLGTLEAMPWRQADGRLWGPGVLDMKSGLAFFVFAMRALRELDIPVSRKVILQVNSDEEVGSHTSRQLTERNASASEAVLVLEPGTGLEGKAKTARKGVGGYRLEVTGVASHAGVDFAAGASAIDELAYQIERIRTFTSLDRGITVNVGILSGGTRTNVVAAHAEAGIDFRIPRLRDWDALRRKFASLKPRDPRARLNLTGELNRPPLERTAGVVRLYKLAQRLAAEVGVQLAESSTGGGSDGNFTAGMGVPTLDGIGGVGEGAHASHESILVDRIADRAALLAKLVAAL
jgi:glutamate carboxypeptidase